MKNPRLTESTVTGHHTSYLQRLLEASDLMEQGIEIKRMNIRRQNPGFDESQTIAALQVWLISRDEN